MTGEHTVSGKQKAGEDDVWTAFRARMPVTRNWAYFDHAAVAPISGPAREAIARWSQEAAETGAAAWSRWAKAAEETRAVAADILGAQRSEIALVPNTTSGITLVAEGYPWQSGDNVVVPAGEFPSNLYPWMNLAGRGVQTRRVPMDESALDVDRLLDACDDRTRLISLSWVGYKTGWRVDVGQVVDAAHRRGILVFLDAIQGLGVFPLDVAATQVDFLAADGHKWMLGPEGAGIFYCRREHLARLRPLVVGWNSVVQGHDFGRIEMTLRDEAARYEGGSQNLAGMLALGASLRMLHEAGLGPRGRAIAQRVLEITDLACRQIEQAGGRVVSRREGEHGSGIVAFEMPGRDPQAERRRLLKRGVALNSRGGWLRLSPHAYNNEADIKQLVAALTDGA
jgi:selenocysteine lyase/cysteine desulfurase